MSEKDLQQLLQDDRQKLDDLYDLLQAERSCLEKRDLDQLNALLQQKQTLLGAIENNDYQRRQLLQKAGLPANQTSLSRLKALLKQNSPQAVDLVEAIERRLQQCRDLSETNKVIVHRSKLNTQRALEILNGSQPLANVYNSHGTTGSSTVKRNLGNA